LKVASKVVLMAGHWVERMAEMMVAWTVWKMVA
jgi:hypothetical protein